MDQSLPTREWESLRRAPLFDGCSQEDIRRALDRPGCRLESFSAGQTLYEPWSFQRSLGVVLSGEVRVSREQLAISILGPGEMFGAAALFNDLPDYAATLTACTPCRAVFFSQELLERMLADSAAVRDNYIRYLTGRIRFLSGRVQTLSAGDVSERLHRYLLAAAAPGRRTDCSATELARRLGISRASLYRAFDALERRGVIRREGKSVVLLEVPETGQPPV